MPAVIQLRRNYLFGDYGGEMIKKEREPCSIAEALRDLAEGYVDGAQINIFPDRIQVAYSPAFGYTGAEAVNGQYAYTDFRHGKSRLFTVLRRVAQALVNERARQESKGRRPRSTPPTRHAA